MSAAVVLTAMTAATAGAATDLAEPGTPVQTSSSGCTIGYLALDSESPPAALTAGHCGRAGEEVFSQKRPIGSISASEHPAPLPGGLVLDRDSPDWASVALLDGVAANPSSDRIAPARIGAAAPGDRVCGQGATTGWRCGRVTAVEGDWIVTDIQRSPGDSGGPLYRPSDRAALGILSSVSRPLVGARPSTSRYYALRPALRAAGLRLVVSPDEQH